MSNRADTQHMPPLRRSFTVIPPIPRVGDGRVNLSLIPPLPPPQDNGSGSDSGSGSGVSQEHHYQPLLPPGRRRRNNLNARLSVANQSAYYQSAESQGCVSHAGKRCYNYCLIHDCLVCQTCIKNAHKKCSTPELGTVAAEIKQISSRVLGAVEKNLLGCLQSSIGKAKKHRKSLHEKAESLKDTERSRKPVDCTH